jgi:hypothetical protein
MNKKVKTLLTYMIPILTLMLLLFVVIRIVSGSGPSFGKSCPPGTAQFDGSGPCVQIGDPICDNSGNPNNTCQNEGKCIIPTGEKSGRCQCTLEGTSGQLCGTACTSIADCKNSTGCLNGKCQCNPGYHGVHCENSIDPKDCDPGSGCNMIMINEISWNPKLPLISLSIMDPSIQSNSYIPLKKGDIVCLDGFIDQNNTSFSQFNNWQSTSSQEYTVIFVSELEQNTKSTGENLGSCYYYCDGNINANSPETCNMKTVGPLTYDLCNTESALNRSSNSRCYESECLQYFTIQLVPKHPITVPAFPYVPYTVFVTGGIYIVLPPTGYNYPKTYPPKCYSGTKTDSSGVCGGCISELWGPGRTYKTSKQNPLIWNNRNGKKSVPVGGYCGRMKNTKQIALGIEPSGKIVQSSDCTTAYGEGATLIKAEIDQCVKFGVEGDKFTPLCAVSDFWALPGTNCQTGDWARCDQCSSDNGTNDENNSQGYCGLVGAPATTTATPYSYKGGNPSSYQCTLPSNTIPDPHL